MEPLPDHLRATCEHLLEARGVRGLAVCGFDTDGIRFAGGVGVADIERGERVEPSTVFRVASISKLVTTALILRSVDRGDIDLDAPVNRYLPAAQHVSDPDGRPASSTVRSLLSHSSGLPFGVRGVDLGNPLSSWVANGGRVRTLADAVTGLRTRYPVGERVVYSNPAFNVLGQVAAQLAGRPFEDAVRDDVLAPAGMAGATFAHRAVGPGVATPYGSISPPKVGPKPAGSMRLVATPMGGLTASVLDLARFGRMILGGGSLDGRSLLARSTVEEATRLQATNHPALEQGYGLGFKVRSWRGRTTVGHDGNMPGVATRMVLSPSDGTGIVVLTNGFALAVPHEVAQRGLEHLLQLGSETAPPRATPSAPSVARSVATAAEGTYHLLDSSPPGVLGLVTDRYVRIRATHEGDGRLRLDGSPGSDGPVRLHPEGEAGCFRVEAPVDRGTNAVLEERADGLHLWLSHTTHLLRRA